MSRQDRQGVRLPADVERKWGFKKKFDNAMKAAEAASNSVKELDKSLTQKEVFNRLTNGGKSQGLFMDVNGQVYINASYITAGILASLDNETFYLDLVNGVLKGKFEEFTVQGKTVDKIASEQAETIASNKAGTALDDAKKYADEAAKKAAKEAVDGQTQADIFNKLTNNGQNEGVYIINGQVFVNASYISSGILASQDGTTFYLDLDNGVVKGNFSEMSISGKKVSWKENTDGTFTLIGT